MTGVQTCALPILIEKLLWERLLVKLPSVIRHIYTMAVVILGWSLFAWQEMADSKGFMKTMFLQAGAGFANTQTKYLLCSYSVLLIIAAVFSSSMPKRVVTGKLFPKGTAGREFAGMVFVAVISAACIAMLVNSSYNPFLYFRF